MKSIEGVVLGLFLASTGLSQTNAPQIEWQAVFGGTGWDYGVAVLPSPDGGYLVAGSSNSEISGNKTSPNFGGYDFWLLKVDERGSNVWQRTFGGSADEHLTGFAVAPNGDSLLLGDSFSGISGNKTAPIRGTNATDDAWLVRVDASGNKRWDRSYGGSGRDYSGHLVLTRDQHIVIIASSASPADGNKTAENFGGFDYWVVKLDAEGNMIWDKSFGGEGEESALPILELRDGGLLLGGSSSSYPSGNKTSPRFDPPEESSPFDYWIVRLDKDGNKVWDQSHGGTGFEMMSGLVQDKNDNLLLLGFSSSPASGNKTSPYYDSGVSNWPDYWMVKLDEPGNKLWDRTYGGTFTDSPIQCIQTLDGNYLVIGYSSSQISGTKTTSRFGSGTDGWLVRLDGDGNQLWDMTLGGDYLEETYSVMQTQDGGYLVVGLTSSPVSGNKTVPNASSSVDLWLVKLRPDVLNLRPRPQTVEAIRTKGFQLWLSAPTNTYVIDVSTNLTEWQPFQTNVLMSNSVVITDVEATNSTRRFYRARVAEP